LNRESDGANGSDNHSADVEQAKLAMQIYTLVGQSQPQLKRPRDEGDETAGDVRE
jgi:hypothetical protein